MDRRDFVKLGAGGLVLAGSVPLGRLLAAQAEMGPANLPSGMLASMILDALPGKRPLIKKTFRPPNYETPIAYFNAMFTPNDVFYVRYHLSHIPEIDGARWRLTVAGPAVGRPLELSLEALKRDFEQVELAAVNQCSGNRRGLFEPHVPGVEWGYGAMGNAVWKGVRLRDVLARANLAADAVEIAFDGADAGVVDKTPDFIKSLPVWKAMDQNTLIAYEMNGAPLPHWNGFPARLVVPGWTGTYWVKHLVSIQALKEPLKGFWMNPAYRIPKGRFPVVERFTSQETDANTPITEMVVNSLITQPFTGQTVRAGSRVEVRGIAWDAGYGITRVEVSTDRGGTWQTARLGKDHGRFSWRQWSAPVKAGARGTLSVMARATNRIGQSQTFELIPNPAGYYHNVVHEVTLQVG